MFRSYVISKLIIDCVKQRLPFVGQVACQSMASGYSGHIKGDLTNRLEFIYPETQVPIPIYQVLDFEGNIREEKEKPNVSHSRTKEMILRIL